MKFVDLDAQFHPIENEVNQAIARVMQHKQFIMGPEIKQLEQMLAEYCGVKHVLTAASGTDALLMGLMAHGVGPGDAIIVPSFTFIASAEMVALLGATVVFADVDKGSFNLTGETVEQAIRRAMTLDAVNLKGIIPVDLFGLPADMNAIQAVAKKHELFVLCDIAQSFGAVQDGIKTGQFGDLSATSFFPAKPLGCYGDGGAVFTNNTELADVIESIRFHGKGVSQYENIRIGLTGRMDTLQAAILMCKLRIFDQELALRQAIAERYNAALADYVGVPSVPPNCASSWAVYTIRSEKRDQIKQYLQDKNIPCAVYYSSPLHTQPVFSNTSGNNEDFPVTNELSRQVISLPIHPYLNEVDQQLVIEAVIRGVTQ